MRVERTPRLLSRKPSELQLCSPSNYLAALDPGCSAAWTLFSMPAEGLRIQGVDKHLFGWTAQWGHGFTQ